MTIRVLLVDDQEMVRDGLAVMLSAAEDVDVVGEAADGEAAIARSRELRPDVVVMDIRMPGVDGIAATRSIIAAGLARVLVLTTFDLDEYVFDALSAGASGFMLKNAPIADLLHAVRVVAGGESLLAPTVTTRLIRDVALRRRPTASPRATETLTPREYEVLLALARGESNSEIAMGLFVSEQTIKSHVSHILAKLNLRDRIQAVVYCYENRIV